MAFRERRRTALLLLKNIEKKLTNGEESQASTGKKNSSNKRLVGQGGERACLEVADFGDELIERLSFRIDFVAHQAKPSQIIERSFTQLLSRSEERRVGKEGFSRWSREPWRYKGTTRYDTTS